VKEKRSFYLKDWKKIIHYLFIFKLIHLFFIKIIKKYLIKIYF
jgi:hypothetical protein